MGQTAGFAAGSWALFIDGPTGCQVSSLTAPEIITVAVEVEVINMLLLDTPDQQPDQNTCNSLAVQLKLAHVLSFGIA